MDPKLRNYFDQQLETVLAGLPQRLLVLLDETPLHVEDYPPREVLRDLGIEHRDELCGLFHGVALTRRSVNAPWLDPSVVTLYREGIMSLASSAAGHLNQRELLKQIRITLLHELGHLHGLDEADLDALGYG